MTVAMPNHTNPEALLRELGRALHSRKETRLGLIVANVENLDQLTSAFGYAQALPVLATLSERLRAIIGVDDTLIRFSESKYAILINRLKNDGHLVLAVSKILRELAHGSHEDEGKPAAQLRIGATASCESGDDPDYILQQAETALLAARQHNKEFLIYEPEQSTQLKNAIGMGMEIESALDRGEISMHYQPKVCAADRRPVGAEALMRWQSSTHGFVSPEVFIPIADETGQIESLTWFGINTAFRQWHGWPDRWGALSVAINVTPAFVQNSDLEELLMSMTGLWGLAAENVTIEVTENALMRPETSFAPLNAARDFGARVSIDDFGTGYSSLAYFNNIPADELKIDKSFVMRMLEDEGYARVVRTIVNLAHSFGLRVTAEGVEDRETANALAALKCDYLQGYYFSRPLPQNEFIAWLENYTP
jgi:EAL domain-containing protein (putative c-di-GMP-specific phosphodiesterase class I)/GGDEF domain-containing protein